MCIAGCACLGLLVLAVPASSAAEECPNESIREQQSATYLPDCRAYEMVTPPYKEGWPVGIGAISESGTELLGTSFGVFSTPENVGTLQANYQVTRTPSGWGSTSLDAPASMFSSFEVEALTPDLHTALWRAATPASPEAFNFYLGSPRAPFTPLGPTKSLASPGTGEGLGLIGASRDLSHTVYTIHAPGNGIKSNLWPGDETVGDSQPSLYEYIGTGNTEPLLVGVSDEGPVAHIAESHLISRCGTELGSALFGVFGLLGNAYNAISEDGSTIFFTALGEDYGVCEGLGVAEPPVNELFARIDNGEADAHTVAISEPSAADCTQCVTFSPADAEYQSASKDGSEAFFTTAQPLLGSDATQNLYLYDFNAPQGERVIEASASADPEGARVRRVLNVSEDGSHVYFTAQGLLASNQGAAEPQAGVHPSAEEGAENLYLYQRDAAHPQGQLTFIATAAFGRNAQTTPDGRFLLFESPSDLTADQEGREEAGQVFEYDSQAQILLRVSRGQNGFNEDGNSSLYAATIPFRSPRRGAFPTEQFTRLALSADGAYIFFTSGDALTSQVTEGTTNVYSYHDGRVSLISDGRDSLIGLEGPVVRLEGTDPSGRDVYFETEDRLLSRDTDSQRDLYDARIGGGFPPPPPPPLCSEDPCQGTQSQPPAAQPPATPGFNGPPDPSPSHRKHHKHHRRRHGHRAGAKHGRSR